MNGIVLILVAILLLAARKKVPTLDGFSPVDQTISGRLPSGQLTGNCFPACIASILGLPLNKVPFFSTESGKVQLEQASKWLRGRGIKLVQIPSTHQPPRDAYYMVSGQSPRFPSANHMVVGRNGKIVHDPHPDRTGIIGAPVSFMYLESYG